MNYLDSDGTASALSAIMLTKPLTVNPGSFWLVWLGIALWASAQTRPLTPDQAMADLTDRLRDPQRRKAWALRHPLKYWHTR